MAALTAQSVVLSSQYQVDAVKNTQEAPGDGVFPADGSNIAAGGTGLQTSIFTIPQPGKGFPTGKDATHSTGTYPRLVTAVLHHSTDTVAGQGTATPVGMSVVADSHSHAGVNDLKNSLQNDTSAMALGNASVPAGATGTRAIDGLSQSPETLG